MLLPTNRLVTQGGDRKGHIGIRINQQWRSCFEWPEKGQVYPIHPGKILADELQDLNMSAAEPARQLHVPSNHMGGRHAVEPGHLGACPIWEHATNCCDTVQKELESNTAHLWLVSPFPHDSMYPIW